MADEQYNFMPEDINEKEELTSDQDQAQAERYMNEFRRAAQAERRRLAIEAAKDKGKEVIKKGVKKAKAKAAKAAAKLIGAAIKKALVWLVTTVGGAIIGSTTGLIVIIILFIAAVIIILLVWAHEDPCGLIQILGEVVGNTLLKAVGTVCEVVD